MSQAQHLKLLKNNLTIIRRAKGFIEFCLAYRLNHVPVAPNNGLLPNYINARIRSRAKKRFLDSATWKTLRNEVVEAQGAVCVRCGSTQDITVDHIKPTYNYPELAMVRDNLQVLCWPCNMAKGLAVIDYRKTTKGN